MIRTLFLESTQAKSSNEIRHFYKELSTLGKHYLVRCTASPRVFRHYTIANCMIPQIYSEIVRCMKNFYASEIREENINLSGAPTNSILSSHKEPQEELTEKLLPDSN